MKTNVILLVIYVYWRDTGCRYIASVEDRAFQNTRI